MQQIALVTGSSSGIGAATCGRLRLEGWHVIGVARRDSPESSESLCVDITDLERLVTQFAGLPPVQLLVHSAATIGPVASLEETEPAAWRQTLETNLLGTYNMLRVGLAGMLAEDGGIAIHLTTGAASKAKPHWSAYAASKAGAEHLVRCAASDISGTNRAVCSLDPGSTETPMQQELRSLVFPDRERFVRAHDDGCLRHPEEVAAAIVELARRDPSDLNGQTFRVGHL
jgi:NAD(P)-dependent dehydrogenase (short-subunit alcohol dehydrogenase family)